METNVDREIEKVRANIRRADELGEKYQKSRGKDGGNVSYSLGALQAIYETHVMELAIRLAQAEQDSKAVEC